MFWKVESKTDVFSLLQRESPTEEGGCGCKSKSRRGAWVALLIVWSESSMYFGHSMPPEMIWDANQNQGVEHDVLY